MPGMQTMMACLVSNRRNRQLKALLLVNDDLEHCGTPRQGY